MGERRATSEVEIGHLKLGGSNAVRIQSMASCRTMDTDACVEQGVRMAEAGAELIRFTAQGVREAANLEEIRRGLRARGVDVPLVADIHFNPRAAFEAAKHVEKVRINPGNFVDPGRTFKKIEFTDEEYAAELKRIDEALVPFLDVCRKNGTAIRIGVNHGSLSDRIMSRYGDTPAGMTESAMEFLRVCKREGFDNVVVSIKASNVVVMVETVRLLAGVMDAEGIHYPLHLGVTEAGDGEDGRVKSAVGIGTLLAGGLGDTIRVSLSEAPENELPVARALADYATEVLKSDSAEGREPAVEGRSEEVGMIGGGNPVRVLPMEIADFKGNEVESETDFANVDAGDVVVVGGQGASASGRMMQLISQMRREGLRNPVVLKLKYEDSDIEALTIKASVDFGIMLLAGYGDGIMIEAPKLHAADLERLSYSILQATRRRITKTEYIACPGCGRTLFDLQSTLHAVRRATEQLKGLKIGVMGCIVNGPGEMADADYGYVGAGAGRVSLYRGKECVEKNIPAEQAVEKLLELIENDRNGK